MAAVQLEQPHRHLLLLAPPTATVLPRLPAGLTGVGAAAVRQRSGCALPSRTHCALPSRTHLPLCLLSTAGAASGETDERGHHLLRAPHPLVSCLAVPRAPARVASTALDTRASSARSRGPLSSQPPASSALSAAATAPQRLWLLLPLQPATDPPRCGRLTADCTLIAQAARSSVSEWSSWESHFWTPRPRPARRPSTLNCVSEPPRCGG